MNEAIRELFLEDYVKNATQKELVDKLVYFDEISKEKTKYKQALQDIKEYIEELAEDTEDYIGAIDRRRKVELLEILDKALGEKNEII